MAEPHPGSATVHRISGLFQLVKLPDFGKGVSPQLIVPDISLRRCRHSVVPDMQRNRDRQSVPVRSIDAVLPIGATNDPGDGSMTFYWTNQQGGRLMFYHDHAYGITRLNVYVGEAAGYYLYDPAEEAALAAATVPGTITDLPDLGHIPLVIQDKTFVPSATQLAGQDPTWIWGTPLGWHHRFQRKCGQPAISGSHTSTCQTRTPLTLGLVPMPSVGGTTVHGSSRRKHS